RPASRSRSGTTSRRRPTSGSRVASTGSSTSRTRTECGARPSGSARTPSTARISWSRTSPSRHDHRPMTSHRALVTAPFRGEGLDTLRGIADVVLDPWIDHTPLRLLDGEKLAAMIQEVEAALLVVESDFVTDPVYDLPLLAIGSCRGDPNNIDIAKATAKGIPVLRAPGRNADAVAEITV